MRIRIGHRHPLVSRKRRLNGVALRMSPEKPSRCGTLKILPYSKVMSAEHRPKFCNPSQAMLTSPFLSRKVLEQDVKQ
jgi:hypothetical protein